MVDNDDNALCDEAAVCTLGAKNIDLLTALQISDSDPGDQGAVVKEIDHEYIGIIVERDTAVAAVGEQR